MAASNPHRPVLLFALFRNDPPGQMTGGTRSNLEIITRLRHFQPIVLTNLDDAFAQAVRDAGIEVRLLPFTDPGKGFGKASILGRLRGLRDVVRTNLAIARIARQTGAWAVQVDEVQAYLAFIGARLARTRLLIYVRNGLPDRPLRARYRIPMAGASAIFCLSREMTAILGRRLPQAAAARLRQHYNAVTMEASSQPMSPGERTAFRTRAGWPPNAVVVLVVGFVDARKRQAEFLRTLATAPDPRLHVAIVGPPKDQAEWDAAHETVQRHRLSVSFHGYQADVTPWYQAADILALPSSAEGVPRAVLEGAAAGLPAVAFDIPGCREAILQGQTGLLAASMTGFVAALSRLAGSEPERQAMGLAGRKHVLDLFEASGNVRRLEALYKELP